MIRINLLPHREMKRAVRRREFNFILLGVLVGCAALWYVGKLYLDELGLSADQWQNFRRICVVACGDCCVLVANA